MAWMDYGEPPQGIGSIERTDFRHVSVFKRIAATIGICIMSIIGGFLLIPALYLFACVFTLNHVGDGFFNVCGYVMIICAIGFAIWLNVECHQQNNQIDTEWEMILNYHKYHIKRRFYTENAENIIRRVIEDRGDTEANLYTRADSFVYSYCNDLPYRHEIQEELEEELIRYIDSNADLIISEANRQLCSIDIHSYIGGRAILRLVSGYEAADVILDILGNVDEYSEKRMFINTFGVYKVNKEFITSFKDYDNSIVNELFDEEYDTFQKIANSHTPYNIIEKLSVGSYLSFMWYYTLIFDEERNSRAVKMVRYFSDGFGDAVELNAVTACMTFIKHKVNKSDRGLNMLKSKQHIDYIINMVTDIANEETNMLRRG